MKKLLQKIFFSSCVMSFAFCISSNAQIIYTDMIDDTIYCDVTPCTSFYALDLNNDGSYDYQIKANRSYAIEGFCSCPGTQTNLSVTINPLASNEYKSSPSSYSWASKINLNNIIYSNGTWRDTVQGILNSRTHPCIPNISGLCSWNVSYSGNWSSNAVDKYVALRIHDGSNVFYGWIRLTVLSLESFIAKDYAYNSISNQPILAGETSCAAPTVTLSASGPLSFCAGDSVKLTANGTGYQYQWKKGGVNITGAKAKTYVAKTAGTYKCKVTNSCGSLLSSGKTITIPCRTELSSVINNLRKKVQHESGIQPAQNNSLAQNQTNSIARLSNASPYAISWTKTLGGNNIDRNDYIGKTIASASGGGYLSMGNTLSDNLPDYHGDVDILATRISSNGTVLWQKCFGGSGDDELHSVIKTNDNGFLIMGYTSSEDGDVASFNHGNYDLWVVKINDAGNIQWEKCYGGTDVEFLASGLQNNDGSFMITTNTLSNDGDVNGNHGDFDIWLLKLDAGGNLLWQKCYGGSGGDYVDGLGIIKTQGGGYALNGDSYSYLSDGDLAGAGFHTPVDPSTDDDAWFVKIDNAGNIQWSKCFGGEGSDWFRYITQFSNGDFIGTGGTIGSGNTGDMPGSYGDYDWWVARMSPNGNLKWSRHYGGSNQETIHNQAIELSNGEIILPSGTNSNDFDVNANTAVKAVWIMKTDADGNFINDNIIGSVGYNQMGGTILNTDGSLTINSMIDTTNIFGDAEFVDANADLLVIKLNPVAVSNHHAQLYNSSTGITDDICTDANSIKLNLRITIPQGFVSWQGVTVKWYKNNNLISTQSLGGAGFTGAYGKTIYKSLIVPKIFGFGDGTYKAKISYDYKTNLFNAYHQKNIHSNNVAIDFNNNCGAKLTAESSIAENNIIASLNLYPNPFSNSTTISFTLNQSQNVSLTVYDLNRRLIKVIADNVFEEGEHHFEWNADNVEAGIYFLKMQSGEFIKTEKLIITK